MGFQFHASHARGSLAENVLPADLAETFSEDDLVLKSSPRSRSPLASLAAREFRSRTTSNPPRGRLAADALSIELQSISFHLTEIGDSVTVSFLTILDSGDLDYAQQIFTQIRLPDSFIFNTVIRGCAWSSKPYEAVSMYNFVKSLGLAPDNFTYPFLLAACGRLAAVGLGRRFHSEVLRKGFGFDVFVVNALVQFYGSCGVFECACKVFDESPVRDVVTWNVMLKTCLSCGFHGKAFRLFEEMTKLSDFKPNDVTIVSLVSACSKLGDLVIGKQIHCYTEINGLDVNLNVGNAILDMYCNCGEVEVGEHLFSKMRKRDVLTWTSLLAGLANSGQFQKCLKLFQYLQSERLKPLCSWWWWD